MTTRRHFIPDAGEQLLLTEDATVAAERLISFMDATGIPPEVLVADPIVTTPIPVGSLADWRAQADPEMLWHPLFWLPERISTRYRIQVPSGDSYLESDAEWALRIALEVQSAGIYDPTDGWLDVLALVGLDTQDPVDLARVEAWADGADDPDIDRAAALVAEFYDVPGRDPNWALEQSQSFVESLLPAQFALTAASMLGLLDQEPDSVGDIAELASDMLADEPSDGPDVLHAVAESVENGTAPTNIIDTVRLVLVTIVNTYAEALDAYTSQPRTSEA